MNRISHYAHEGIRTVRDLLLDSDVRTKVYEYFDFGFEGIHNIRPDRFYRQGIDERKDDLIILLEELGYAEIDWERLYKQTHKQVGHRTLEFTFSGEKILNLLKQIEMQHLEDELTREKDTQLIYFDEQTGIGRYKTKKFRFKIPSKEYSLFSVCYKRRGQRVSRKEVAEIIGINPSKINAADVLNAMGAQENKIRRKSPSEVSVTETINLAVKEIRLKTGLRPDKLVNNSGNITLAI